MGFNITEVVQGSKYKNFMKYLYGWGASVVLMGALFKLQHWPAAGVMLIVGMSTEAIIFFFSAFEPIVEEVDWSIVYPELAGITDEAALRSTSRAWSSMDPGMLESVITSALSKFAATNGGMWQAPHQAAPISQPVAAPQQVVVSGNGGMVFTEKFNDMLEKAQIGPELFTKIGVGLDRLSQASNGIAKITEAVAASETFSGNLQRAGNAVGKFSESYENSGAILARTAQVLSQSFESTAENVATSGKSFTTQLGTLNKNIEALNAAHELQLKTVESRLKESENLGRGVDDMISRISKTVEDSQRYSQSVAKLTENVAHLNEIYGNMLSAMGSMIGGK